MNSLEPDSLPVALAGRVPCKVIGPVNKGDILCTSYVAGHATVLGADDWRPGAMLGKALESCGEGQQVIEIIVTSC
jgi:hypothetical protein